MRRNRADQFASNASIESTEHLHTPHLVLLRAFILEHLHASPHLTHLTHIVIKIKKQESINQEIPLSHINSFVLPHWAGNIAAKRE
jgi:hypothetical protein